jgi:ribokinase
MGDDEERADREVEYDHLTDVAVVGSLNLDLVIGVPHLPLPGETVIGGDVARHPGGKGANQAVAAARLGRRVAMVGCTGADQAGRALRHSLDLAGVETAFVREVRDAPTGMALVAVEPGGENQIVVAPGANHHLDPHVIEAAAAILATAAVTLLQLEVPIDAVEAAARTAAGGRGLVVLNPAPAQQLPAALLSVVDVLVPNRGELARLAGSDPPRSIGETEALARSLGVRSVVVTLGEDGALVVAEGSSTHLPAPWVDVIDTTAAGDAFCGALADALARGRPLRSAARWAVLAGTAACLRSGAQPSLPTRNDVLAISASS